MKRSPYQFHSLFHCADILEKRLATLLTPIGIKPRQARILNVLHRSGEVSQTIIAEWFGVTSGSMSSMIDRMLKVGLIERRKSPEDRRVDLISLAPKGASILEEVKDTWQDIDELIEISLGAEKADLLANLTRELKAALGGQIPGKGETSMPYPTTQNEESS